MRLFLLFLTVPLIEIALFVQVGGLIGLWPTLLLVIATAVAGTVLVRSQGARIVGRLRHAMQDLADPTETLAHGAMVLVSGLLLLTPGFFTDAVGFLLLVPAVRDRIVAEARRRIVLERFGAAPGPAPGPGPGPDPSQPDVIDVDWEDVPPADAPRAGRTTTGEPSGWTRH